MVDLNNADCRRRRRRRISNLITLHKLEESGQEIAANSTDSEDDSIQTDSAVEREVLATMAVGRAVGINFQSDSAAALRVMIEMETKEASSDLVREAKR